MSPTLRKNRLKAFLAQSGRCFYCSAEMWADHSEQFISKHGLNHREAQRFRCTAEHLRPRCDGGGNSCGNIVAACWFCNVTRHRLKSAPEPIEFARHVRKRLRKGQWHPGKYRRLLAGHGPPSCGQETTEVR